MQEEEHRQAKPRRGKPLVHHMDREALDRAYAKAGVKVPRQKPSRRGDKNSRGRNASHAHPQKGGRRMPNENQQPQPGQVPHPNAQAQVGKPVSQILKEEGVKTGLQTVAAIAVTGFGIWLNRKLG